MAPMPKNSVEHFTHPDHKLTAFEDDKEYICDGCKTNGVGKRYRCHGCDYDLHEYCGTCPLSLSSSMHPKHALSLVMRKTHGTRQVNRICDVCADPVEGLFYRCKICEFDVHPVCTQLPEKLHHAMHKIHSLSLESSKIPGTCVVCKGSCINWRYMCRVCNFDIHLECVLVPVVQCPQKTSTRSTQTNERRIPTSNHQIPFRPPPQFAYYNAHGYPYGPGYPYGAMNFNPYPYGQYNMHPNMPTPHNQVSGSSSNGSGRIGKKMFSIVGQLGAGVLSNMLFGVDVTSMF